LRIHNSSVLIVPESGFFELFRRFRGKYYRKFLVNIGEITDKKVSGCRP
jgi:hypothetical protein